MFSFRKKDKEKDKEEKERKKREKKEKKELKKKHEKEKEPMTQEELERLEDVKKGLFRRTSDKRSSKHAQEESHRGAPMKERESPQGTSDSNSSLSSAGRSSFTEKDAGGISPRNGEPPKKHPKIPPKVPHKPAKGILKGKSSYGPEIPNHGVTGKPDDSLTVTSNTIYNLQMSGQLPKKGVTEEKIEPTYENCNLAAAALPKGRHHDEVDSAIPPTIQEEPQINSREKSYDIDLRLPALSPPKPPRVREVVLKRQPAGDFGFTLRRGTMLLRGFGDPGTPLKKNVIFAEPGGKHAHTGLLPGDRLVQVNGVNVEDASREEIIDMIKKSGDAVVLHVQPIPELSELSRRSGLDGVDVNLGDKNVKAGSLQRSGSVRYKKTTVSTTVFDWFTEDIPGLIAL
ncbi:unconventional myosin-XVIIIa [Lingula anatina]|uniref:Unconventional myosin-XVIIIa n=1 Tax=Lingula anatina TaxID=7574 RepID=A0A1S3JVG3_LINAN|nr:unconventional myosin-XVIIIa [Lingula anatina]|eukprot:XP_013414395.1 unconventional myosin-XVIIIa [Lingula anatina]